MGFYSSLAKSSLLPVSAQPTRGGDQIENSVLCHVEITRQSHIGVHERSHTATRPRPLPLHRPRLPDSSRAGWLQQTPTSHKAQKTHCPALSRKPVEPPAKRRRRQCPDPSAYIHVWMVRFLLGLPVSPEDTRRPHGAKADVAKAHCPPHEGGRASTGPGPQRGLPEGQLPHSTGAVIQNPAARNPGR